jgi:hypothetical protein
MALQTEVPLAIAPVAPPQTNFQTVAVPYYPNDEDEPNWCWAACAQMMGSLFLNRLIDQCTFANAVFSGANCCDDRTACNAPVDITDDNIRAIFAVIGKVPNYVPTFLSFEDLEAEIGSKQLPVEVGFQWDPQHGGGGHVAVVCGVSTQGSDQQVYVNDPVYGCGWIEFSNLLSAYGLGSWQCTWKVLG